MSTYGSNTRGGASKKMKKYPRILDYLQAHHEAVYALFDDAGMYGSLTPRRGGNITFLMPDAGLTKDIRAVLEGANPEDATDMLSALILTELYNTTADFASSSDNVATILGKKLPIKTVSGQDVVLDNGAKVSKDKDFVPFERQGAATRGNMAVWLYKGKMWDYKKAAEASSSVEGSGRHKRKRKRGGFMMTRDELRASFIASVESAVGPHLEKHEGSWERASKSEDYPYLKASACIMSALRDEEDPNALDRVIPFVCSPSRAATFYALVDSPLVNTDVLAKCATWESAAFGKKTIMGCINEWMKRTESEGALLSTVDGQKKFYSNLQKQIDRTPKSDFIFKKDRSIVSELINSNTMAGLNGAKVLPSVSRASVLMNGDLFRLINLGAYEMPLRLAEASVDELPQIMRDFNSRYNDSASYNAIIAGEDAYAAIAKKLNNQSWLEMSRERFCKSLLATLPLCSAAASACAKVGKGESVVALKIADSTYSGASERDMVLSESATNELREYIRTCGGLPEEFGGLSPSEEASDAFTNEAIDDAADEE